MQYFMHGRVDRVASEIPAMTSRTASLVSFAAAYRLTAAEAVALPTVLEVASRKGGISESEMLWKMHTNKPLGEYLASICREVRA